MTYSHAATAYRDREVRTASRARLVVMVYDHVLANLARARAANAAGAIPQRIDAISSARAGVLQLVAALDDQQGGDIARNLRSLYAFFLRELGAAGVNFDERRIGRVAEQIRDLRDAFATIAATIPARAPAA